MKTIDVRLLTFPEDLHRQVRARAALEGTTVQDMYARIVRAYLVEEHQHG